MARLIPNASFLARSLFQREGYRRGILGTSNQICNFSTKGKKKSTKSSDGSDSSDEKLSKKELALQQALGQINTTFGKGSIMWLGRSASSKNVPVVSTGSFSLDMALGVGGFPKGRVVEIYGPDASEKTTLALHVIAESQKQGGCCVFVDAEHTFDPALAQAIGVNTENLQLSQPDCGEQALSFVDTLIRSGSVDVVVVNSVAALLPKGEFDGEMGDSPMAMQARLISQVLRKLCHSLFLSQTILIFINQVRSKPSTLVGFDGPSDVTCGGNAVKFYASVRLYVRRIGYVKKGEEAIGSQVQVKVVKNKLAPPFRIAQFELKFGKGICKESEIINLGLQYKFMSQAASFYHFNGRSFCGKDALKTFLSENEDAREELITKLREKLLDAEMGKPQTVDETEGSFQEDIITPPDSSDEHAVTAVEVMKNKLAPPFRNAQFELEFGKAICKETEIIDLGLKYNFISKGGAFFKFNGRSFHGKDAFKTFLSKNEDAREELITKLQKKLLDAEMGKPRNGDETEGSLQEDIMAPPDSRDEDAVTAVEVMKNKLAPPFRNAQFELEFGKGISKESEIIDLASKYKFITKAGAFFKYNGRNFLGKEALKTFLLKNEDVKKELITKLQEKLLDAEMDKRQNGDETEGSLHEDIITPSDSTDKNAVTAIEA